MHDNSAEALRQRLFKPEFPRSSNYDPHWLMAGVMGPHALWLAEWLSRDLILTPGMRVLDLGCGKALSSIFLATAIAETLSMVTLRARLVERVQQFGVEDRPLPGRTDGFSSLCYRGKAFAHFHNDNELDIRLTKQVIRREGLTRPPGSTVHPNRSKSSPWIELRFHTSADLDRVVSFVKMAVEVM